MIRLTFLIIVLAIISNLALSSSKSSNPNYISIYQAALILKNGKTKLQSATILPTESKFRYEDSPKGRDKCLKMINYLGEKTNDRVQIAATAFSHVYKDESVLFVALFCARNNYDKFCEERLLLDTKEELKQLSMTNKKPSSLELFVRATEVQNECTKNSFLGEPVVIDTRR